jgi:hypothetical protein
MMDAALESFVGNVATETRAIKPDYIFVSIPGVNLGRLVENSVVPFQVTSEADLRMVGTGQTHHTGDVWGLLDHYELTTDITLIQGDWQPIGSAGSPFRGVFDGDGHTITGMTINTTNDNTGMFAVIGRNGKVQNVNLESVSIRGGSITGAIAGENRGEIHNCSVRGTIISESRGTGSGGVGGIAGRNFSDTAIITNCSSYANVTGVIRVGGIAGVNGDIGINAGARIERSYATGVITATGTDLGSLAGGIAGSNGEGCAITNSFALGNVISRGGMVGGIVGWNGGSILNCYSAGEVSSSSDTGGGNYLGGLVGSQSSTGFTGNSVALNPSVISARTVTNTYIARVTGYGVGTLENNFARSNMPVSVGSGGSTVPRTPTKTGNDGEDITVAEWGNPEWWRVTAFGGLAIGSPEWIWWLQLQHLPLSIT